MKEKIIYTNELGRSVEISHSSLFHLEKIEGLGSVQNIIHTQKSPYQDGVTETGSNLEPRDITIEGSINSIKRDEILKHRQTLLSVLNPKLEGQLKYQFGDFIRIINCTVELAPVFPHIEGKFKKFLIQLYCPDPFFKSPIITTESLAPFVELFEFSSEFWEVEQDGDIYFEIGFEGEKRELVVHGDVESPVQIKFYGPSTNPVIRNNTTGEFIKVNRELTSEDILFIDTEDAIVTINDENAFNWIDINSTFWKLQVGSNEIEYTADDGVADAKLEIIWNERYLGV